MDLLKSCANNKNVVSLVDSTIREAISSPGSYEIYFLFPLYPVRKITCLIILTYA